MATVAIWKISSSLNQVIKYTTNDEKTDLSNYKDLDKSLEYIKDDFKTEEKLFVSGINCDPTNALKEMVDVKKRFMKEDGILAFHAYQSFKEGEVTPDEAHNIGIELAKEMWGDRFQVVVSTHLNTKHYHNHFVINSVSFVDGKRYYDNRTTYAELRRLNDLICEEHNISYLKENKTKSGLNYLNYQNKGITYSNYYKQAKIDLDIAISKSHSYQEFLTILKNLNYEVKVRSGKLSIRGSNYKRNIRIERYFGIDYSIDNIKKQIQGVYLPTNKNYYKNNKNINNVLKTLLKPKYNSFYSMYIRYSNLIGNYPNYVKNNYISNDIKKDIEVLDMINEETILLVNNKIETLEDFNIFHENKIDKLIELKNKKEDLYKEYKITNDINIKNSIDSINKEIIPLTKEVKLCEDIRLRNNKIKNNLEEIREKEMMKNEYIR